MDKMYAYNKRQQHNQESQQIEWKWSWQDEYLKWLCGYANTEGGILYIGVNDDGYVVGIEDSKRILEGLPNKIHDKLGIIASINIYKANGAENIRYGNHIPKNILLRYCQYGQVGADGIWRNKVKANEKSGDKKAAIKK